MQLSIDCKRGANPAEIWIGHLKILLLITEQIEWMHSGIKIHKYVDLYKCSDRSGITLTQGSAGISIFRQFWKMCSKYYHTPTGLQSYIYFLFVNRVSILAATAP